MQNINLSVMGQNPTFINARGSIENLADEHNGILKIRVSVVRFRPWPPFYLKTYGSLSGRRFSLCVTLV